MDDQVILRGNSNEVGFTLGFYGNARDERIGTD